VAETCGVELVKRARLSSTGTLSLRWKKGGKASSKRSKEAREIYHVIAWNESIPRVGRCSRPASSIKLVRRILEALQPVIQQWFEKRTRRIIRSHVPLLVTI
jgi:predicted metal-dependent RNase